MWVNGSQKNLQNEATPKRNKEYLSGHLKYKAFVSTWPMAGSSSILRQKIWGMVGTAPLKIAITNAFWVDIQNLWRWAAPTD